MKKIKAKLLFVLIICFFYIYKKNFSDIGVEEIRDVVLNYGIYAPLIYILIFAFLPITFFPVPILALAGGVCFGVTEGTIYTLIGAFFNSAIMFFMARYMGKDYIIDFLHKKVKPEKLSKYTNIDNNNGFFLIFILRLIPIMPYNVINYMAGLTEVSFSKYNIATMLGILPGTIIFLNVGDKMKEVHSKEFMISLALLVSLTIGSFIAMKIISRKEKKSESVN